MEGFAEIVFYIFILSLMFGYPLFLTGSNLYNLFAKKKFIPAEIDWMIFITGPLLTILMYSIWNPQHWERALIVLHQPIENTITILILVAIAIIGYAVLRIFKTLLLSPMVIVLCLSAQYIGCVLSVMWIIQFSPNLFEAIIFFPGEVLLMCLFPLNYIISSIALIRRISKETSEMLSENNYKNKLLIWCGKATKNSLAFPIAAFIFIWPLLGLIIMVLMLFGQQPDSAIKAFTETSDWLFSKRVSPPAINPGYEYICTAAAGGHKRIVKPMRIGIRKGSYIIVNRQLCVTNAFEELMQEKTPRLHKILRRVYDVIGYAIAKRIRKPLGADIAYLLMKPMEWFALFILYLFERKPENRIARQYLNNE